MASAKSAVALRRLPFGASNPDALIVIIPDRSFRSFQQNEVERPDSWLRMLCKGIPNAHVYCFDYWSSLPVYFDWTALLGTSLPLLGQLQELRLNTELANIPVQFISIGLGGLVAKDALRHMTLTSREHKDLKDVLSGCAFIGTPHIIDSDPGAWQSVAAIPRLKGKQTRKSGLGTEEAQTLANLCSQFDHMELHKPFFSMYETLDTLIPSRRPFGKKSIKVLGEDRCTIKSNKWMEHHDGDYNALCNPSVSSNAFKQLDHYLKVELDAVRSTLSSRTYQEQIMDAALDGSDYTMMTPLSCHAKRSRPNTIPRNGQSTGATTVPSYTGSYERIPDVIDFAPPIRRDPVLPCHLTGDQHRNPHYFHRPDLYQRIEDHFLPSHKSLEKSTGYNNLKAFVLCGQSCLGKTELAAEFMFRNLDKFDAVFWLHSNRTSKLRDSFTNIAVQLGLETEAEAKDEIISAEIVKGWLGTPYKKGETQQEREPDLADWLIIFDNVNDLDELDALWPSFGQGCILVTSRKSLAEFKSFSGDVAGLDLKAFDYHDSTKFLLSRLGSNSRTNGIISKSVQAIAAKPDGLPIGLVQLAAVMKQCRLTPAELARRYDAWARDLPESVIKNIRTSNLPSLYAVDQLGPQAVAVVDLLAFLDADCVGEWLLEQLGSQVTITDFPHSTDSYQLARDQLSDFALIRRDGERQTLRVYQTTHDVVRGRMTPVHYKTCFTSSLALISAAWPFPSMQQRHQTDRWPKFNALMPHVLQLKDLYQQHISPHELFIPDISFAKLLASAAWYLHERGGDAEFLDLLDCAETVCDEHPEPLESIDIRSDIYYTRGADKAEKNQQQRALENNEEFLNLRREIARQKDEKDPKLAHAFCQAANAHLDQGNVAKAINLYRQGIAILKTQDDYDHGMATIAIANLGTAYWLRKEYNAAEELIKENLRWRETKYGKNDETSFRTGRLLHVLGNVCASQGRMGESFQLHQRALRLYRATVGDNHHRTADLCCLVSKHWLREGRPSYAKSPLMKALAIYRSKDYYKPELARTYYLLSRMHGLENNQDDCQQYRRKALEIYHELAPIGAYDDNMIGEAEIEAHVTFASR